jgi:ferric-dicitrate binding protein FerR (iron transport regulator)
MQPRNRQRPAPRWLIAAILLLLIASPAAARVTVTSVEGPAVAGDGELAMHGIVSDGETVETREDGRCSLLLAESAVIQICNRAALRLREEGSRGPRVLELSRGELKASVAPRPVDEPLEIHTPVAIATILGTVVHVSVDPETGETTITSIENRVRVASTLAPDEAAVVLESGQQVVVGRGRVPGPVRQIDRQAMLGTSECLDADDFRQAAIAAERSGRRKAMLDRIAAMDVPAAGLPGVASPAPSFSLLGYLDRGISKHDVCSPAQPGCDNRFHLDSNGGNGSCVGPGCNRPGPIPPPDPCVGVPGDQCLP